jgi:starvation-inducible outer membrane lipoprotein
MLSKNTRTLKTMNIYLQNISAIIRPRTAAKALILLMACLSQPQALANTTAQSVQTSANEQQQLSRHVQSLNGKRLIN